MCVEGRRETSYSEAPCIEGIFRRRGLCIGSCGVVAVPREARVPVRWHLVHRLYRRDGGSQQFQIVRLILGLDLEAQRGG